MHLNCNYIFRPGRVSLVDTSNLGGFGGDIIELFNKNCKRVELPRIRYESVSISHDETPHHVVYDLHYTQLVIELLQNGYDPNLIKDNQNIDLVIVLQSHPSDKIVSNTLINLTSCYLVEEKLGDWNHRDNSINTIRLTYQPVYVEITTENDFTSTIINLLT